MLIFLYFLLVQNFQNFTAFWGIPFTCSQTDSTFFSYFEHLFPTVFREKSCSIIEQCVLTLSYKLPLVLLFKIFRTSRIISPQSHVYGFSNHQPNFQQVHVQVLSQTVIVELCSVYEQLFTSSLKECLNLFHEKIFKIFMIFFFSELVFKVFQVPQWTLGFQLGSCSSSFPDSDSRTPLLRSS